VDWREAGCSAEIEDVDVVCESKDGEGDDVETEGWGSLIGEVSKWSKTVVIGKVEGRIGEEKLPEGIGAIDLEGASSARQGAASRFFAGKW